MFMSVAQEIYVFNSVDFIGICYLLKIFWMKLILYYGMMQGVVFMPLFDDHHSVLIPFFLSFEDLLVWHEKFGFLVHLI